MWTEPELFGRAIDATLPTGWETTTTPANGIRVNDAAAPQGHDVRFSGAWRDVHHWDAHRHLFSEQISIDASKRIEAALFGSTTKAQFLEQMAAFAYYFTDATSANVRAAAAEAWDRRTSDTYDYSATGTADAGSRDPGLYRYQYRVAVPGNWSIEEGLRRLRQERGPPDDGESTWKEVLTGPGGERLEVTYLAYAWSVPLWTATGPDGRVLQVDGSDYVSFSIPRREGQTESDVLQARNATFEEFGWPAPGDQDLNFTGTVC